MKKKVIITPKILITLYKGHLPVAWGHLDPGDGKTWLGVAVADGYSKKGYGSRIVEELCKYADNAGWELWLTSADYLKHWYERYGFILIKRIKGKSNQSIKKKWVNFMRRPCVRLTEENPRHDFCGY